jgi:hypothetical protein
VLWGGQSLLAAGYVSVRNNKEEPRLVSSDEWFLRKYSTFSCKIFPRDIFIAFYGNFRPCFQHISLRNIFPHNLSFGINNKMSRNEALPLLAAGGLSVEKRNWKHVFLLFPQETPKKRCSGLPKKESLGSVSKRNTCKTCFPNVISLGNRSGRQECTIMFPKKILLPAVNA